MIGAKNSQSNTGPYFSERYLSTGQMSFEKHDSNDNGANGVHGEEIDLLSFHEQRAGRLVIDPE